MCVNVCVPLSFFSETCRLISPQAALPERRTLLAGTRTAKKNNKKLKLKKEAISHACKQKQNIRTEHVFTSHTASLQIVKNALTICPEEKKLSSGPVEQGL